MAQYTMTAERFKSAYPVIKTPGKYQLTVRSVSNPIPNNNLPGQTQVIVNLRAVFPQHITPDLINSIKNDTDVDVTNLRTASFNMSPNSQLPGKGELVNVTVGFVESSGKMNKTGQKEMVLAVTAISIPPAVQVSQNSWDSLIPKEEDAVVTTEGDERVF